jgi:MFS family permease
LLPVTHGTHTTNGELSIDYAFTLEEMMEQDNKYQWPILALVVLTNMFTVAIPMMGMAVLAEEISTDLRLNVVQVGIVWGVGALPGIITSLVGGAIGDKFGAKRVLVVGVLLAGLLGMLRGLAFDFFSMTIVVILLGAVIPFVTTNGIKTVGTLFPARQRGLVNGLISMGMALGFLIGSQFSATTFSPLLGGWRNVFFAYGLIGMLFSIPWFFARMPTSAARSADAPFSIRKTLQHVSRLKNVWLLGLTLFGVSGAIQGILGYLPLHLRGLGWQPIYADSALSAFHTVSLVFVLPLALWSDRLGSRKRLLLFATLMVTLGAALLSVARGGLVWAAVLLCGFVRDAYMAIFTTMVIEAEGVDPDCVGTALGFTMAISSIGNVISPPIGNSLVFLWPGAPFLFWSGMAILGMICLLMVKQPRTRPILEMATGS